MHSRVAHSMRALLIGILVGMVTTVVSLYLVGFDADSFTLSDCLLQLVQGAVVGSIAWLLAWKP